MKTNFFTVTINRKKKKKVFIKDVIYIEADGAYSIIHFANNTSIILSRVLKSFTFLTLDFNFFRANRSYIINLDFCYELSSGKPNYLLMANNKKINIYGNKYTLLLKKEFS